MTERVVVTVTLTVTLGADSSARLQPALDYVLGELEVRLGAMTPSETKITAASARFEQKEQA